MFSTIAASNNRRPSARCSHHEKHERRQPPRRHAEAPLEHLVGGEHLAAKIAGQQEHDDRQPAHDVAERDLQKREVAVLHITTCRARSETSPCSFPWPRSKAAATRSAVGGWRERSRDCPSGRAPEARPGASCRNEIDDDDQRIDGTDRDGSGGKQIQTHRLGSSTVARFTSANGRVARSMRRQAHVISAQSTCAIKQAIRLAATHISFTINHRKPINSPASAVHYLFCATRLLYAVTAE